jgi:hypothetical protein
MMEMGADNIMPDGQKEDFARATTADAKKREKLL